jgi:hypothetical protein
MMADYTLTPAQTGLYELALTADSVTRIDVGSHFRAVQLIVHTAPSPVYVRLGSTITLKDPLADIALEGSWIELSVPYMTPSTVSIISHSNAVVSVARV